ncbi:MAG TPA: LemA family protein, partial [Chitinophagaceae bacterium]|nr:LemA family protein [Chitinophagaceae bacterium]
KGAADFEKETYVQVALARAGELKQKVENLSADDLTPEKLAEIQEANAQSRQAANTMINVMVERYPDLKATQNFLSLQDQLEGTENRITMARNDYNNIVKTYNTTIRRFPATLYAGFLGFERKTMFEAEAGAEKAPEVSF